MYKEATGWALTALLISCSIVRTLSFPNTHPYPATESGFYPSKSLQMPVEQRAAEERKFAEKPNAIKKVALDDLDDIQTNQISESSGGGGFSWSNLLGMLMQMIFSPATNQGPNKSEGLDDGPVPQSPWANLLSVGLKILTAILGGGHQGSEGIDKVDNGGSPLQGVLGAVLSAVVGTRDPEQVNMLARQAGEFINIVVNLLEALKTSFSHRSMAARHLGKKDSISDATVAGIAMMKGYIRSLATGDTKCMEKYLCEANNECSNNIGQTSMYCPLGGYALSFVLDKSVKSPSFEVLYEASKKGRHGMNCQQQFVECNEV